MRSELSTRVFTALASAPLRGPALPVTLSALAQGLGVQVGTLSGFLGGSYKPGRRSASVFSMDRLAQALQVPVHTLGDGGPCPACGQNAEHMEQHAAALRVVVAELQQVADRLGGLPMGAAVRVQVDQLQRIIGETCKV